MFLSAKLENLKTLKDVTINMSKANQPKSVVSIYGENGSGKSSIILAFQILALSVRTMEFSEKLLELQAHLKNGAEKLNELPFETMLFPLFQQFSSFENIIHSSRMIGAKENTTLQYTFLLNNNPGKYSLEYDEKGLVREELSYRLKTRSIVLFSITKDDVRFQKATILDAKLKRELTEDIEKLWGTHTFLSILSSAFKRYNQSFLKDFLLKELLVILDKFQKIGIRNDEFGLGQQLGSIKHNLVTGTIPFEEKETVENNVAALFTFYSAMYTDIVDVFYQYTQRNNQLHYQLFFAKKIGGEIRHIPFQLESHGTRKLLELFPIFVGLYQGETVVIDEIDAGIHDLLIQKIIENLTDEMKGQLIFTTHDTFILRELPKEYAYFINITDEGNREVYSVDQFEGVRVQPNNNLQRMYLNGNFGGVPFPMDLDMERVIELLGGGQ